MKINSVHHSIYKDKANTCVGKNNENGRYNSVSAVSFSGLYSSKKFGGLMEWFKQNYIGASALISLVFASVLRPITIMSLPGQKKNKEDKLYASSHSFSSGVIGFIASTAVTTPIGQALRKIQEKPESYGKSFKAFIEQENAVRNSAGRIIKTLPEWWLAIPRAMMTIALIPYIQKYVFGIEKKPHKAPEAATTNVDFVNKNVFQEFRGRAAV